MKTEPETVDLKVVAYFRHYILTKYGMATLDAISPDRPEHDGTDWAHPAWHRGVAHGMRLASQGGVTINHKAATRPDPDTAEWSPK